jgi:hypothetical protein
LPAFPLQIGTLLKLRRLNFMPQDKNADPARAERIFKAREFQRNDASKAMADYHADLQRVRDRTQELKRLRLEREAQQPRSIKPKYFAQLII